MRSALPAHCPPGNVNLKGKKRKVMSCKCCDAVNFKCKMIDSEHKKEIEYYKDNNWDIVQR